MDQIQNKRWALSAYVDYRVGIITGKVMTPREARDSTEETFGVEFANWARAYCGEAPKKNDKPED